MLGALVDWAAGVERALGSRRRTGGSGESDIAKVGFRREGPCDGFSDSNPSWPPLLSTLRGRFQTTIQSQMARTWRREFRPEHAFVRIKMLFLERVTTSSREHAKDEI
jgi:hypothetical protein